MTMMTLGEAHVLLSGSQLIGDPATAIERVHSDTRSLAAGDLFVALRGERFDANDFLVQAREAGATAAIAERGLADAGLPGLLVPDSRRALGELAAGWRRHFALPLVAVTRKRNPLSLVAVPAGQLKLWLPEPSAPRAMVSTPSTPAATP